MNKEINSKLDEIVVYIKNNESYKNYLKAKDILNNRNDLKKIIENIKKIQKKIVNNPHKKQELEKELNDNIKILESDITYLEYNNYLIEVNNMLAILENKLNKYFEDIFN